MSRKRFIYQGYLQIAELDAADASESAEPVLRKTYLWDPLEPVATRVLAMSVFDETGTYVEDLYYTHDALKNTTALFGIQGGPASLVRIRPVWECSQDGRQCGRNQSLPLLQRVC